MQFTQFRCDIIHPTQVNQWVQQYPPTFRWISRNSTSELIGYGIEIEIDSIFKLRKVLQELSNQYKFDCPIFAYTVIPFNLSTNGLPIRWCIPKVQIWLDDHSRVIVLNDPRSLEMILADYSWESFPNVNTYFPVQNYPTFDTWKQQMDQIQHAIHQEVVKKVVLSRQQVYPTTHYHPNTVFQRMKRLSSHNYKIQFQTSSGFFQSVTPECVLKVNGKKCFTDSLAGSKPIGNNPMQQQQHTNRLIHSSKEQWEHSLVSDGILQSLQPYLPPNAQFFTEKYILTLDYIQHLYTIIEFEILDETVLDAVIHSIHPTAAIAGSPRDTALQMLQQLHEPDRGYYCGLAGWCTLDQLELAVLIRSAMIQAENTIFYAGAGIVESSDATAEWEETELKMSIMKKIVLGN
ncbi:MAG: chorismate-binding protein [bacterium]|nr:chorismate-binding protein [bacterium]